MARLLETQPLEFLLSPSPGPRCIPSILLSPTCKLQTILSGTKQISHRPGRPFPVHLSRFLASSLPPFQRIPTLTWLSIFAARLWQSSQIQDFSLGSNAISWPSFALCSSNPPGLTSRVLCLPHSNWRPSNFTCLSSPLGSSLLLTSAGPPPADLSNGLPLSLDSSLFHECQFSLTLALTMQFRPTSPTSAALPAMTSNPWPFQCFTRLELPSGCVHSPALDTLSLKLTISCELHWFKKKNHKKHRNQKSHKCGDPALTRSNSIQF